MEITELLLVHCNIVKKAYQQDLAVLYTFVPRKQFGQLLFGMVYSPPLEIGDRIKLLI